MAKATVAPVPSTGSGDVLSLTRANAFAVAEPGRHLLPEGTEVTLTVVSPGEAPREVTLERRRIDPVITPDVRRLESDPSIGYLQVLALSGQEAVDGLLVLLDQLGQVRIEDVVEKVLLARPVVVDQRLRDARRLALASSGVADAAPAGPPGDLRP